MGIYDREYYRREGPSFLEAFGGRGSACKWLILLNVGLFILQFVTGGRDPFGRVDGGVTGAFRLDTGLVLEGQIWRLFTYAFLHDPASFWHIFFNMLFLWWFGSDVEDVYGTREFTAFYLMAALFGGLFQVSHDLLLVEPARYPHVLGASGAVTAVMVLCACHFPQKTILLFFVLPVPIWLLVIFNVAQDLFGLLGGSQSNTAFSVHLGGAAFAFVYYNRQWRMLNVLPDLRAWRRRQQQPRLRVYREEEPPQRTPVAVAAPVDQDLDEHLEAKVDALLEKIKLRGKQSLTESELGVLKHAGDVYKKRRS